LFRTKTVFVLGAGTSVDFGFPSGPSLLHQIREALNFSFDHLSGQPTKGDPVIFDALKAKFRETRSFENTNRVLLAGHRLVKASQQAISIDNAIDTLEDPDISLIGKLAIARSILSSEKSLRDQLVDRNDPTEISISKLSNSWLPIFLQLLTSDVRRSQVNTIFENVSIINFNYDRVLEYILPHMLARHYSIDVNPAREAFELLKIFRPYGKLGRLNWQQSDTVTTEFGGGFVEELLAASLELKTFTEQIEDSELLLAMESELYSASRIVFLGFGYHRQNIRLLSRPSGAGGEVIGTTFKMPIPEVETVRRDIRSTMLQNKSVVASIGNNPHDIMFVDTTSDDLLKSYGRRITS
jgi:hypothetical protein